MAEKTHVFVSLDGEDRAAGTLWFHSRNGRESASFEYNPEWLGSPDCFALEPGLQITAGTFHTRTGLSLFGALGDSAPDRWGRILLRRNEERRAKSEGRAVRTLSELDYLLGIHDEGRQGALRFKQDPAGPFLSPQEKNAIPPLLALPRLLFASERFLESREDDEDLRLLLAPGSSLGGARPKASVYDKGELAIAKFPRKDDDFSAVRWEALALTLAAKAGICVTSWRLEKVLDKPVLIIKRFDRQGNKRVPFLSAMSMLGAKDNEDHSYPEIAYAISRYGAAPEKDLAELWRRLVFNIAISNIDDHLRNHGFLHAGQKGWRLSPAYDMNPVPREISPRVLSLAIDFTSREASLETALQTVADYRLTTEAAAAIIGEVKASVRQWKSTARALQIPSAEIERMASAFAEP